MILGSHNSWSYLTPRKWWMKLIRFTARCQSKELGEQYAVYGVRCFDLRVRFDDDDQPMLVHGPVEYEYTREKLEQDLKTFNSLKSVCIRVLLDVRNKRQYTEKQRTAFWNFCHELELFYPDIKFWCGRNLYNWGIIYNFQYRPTCCERYASVCKPRLIDDWFPYFFAHRWNKLITEQGTTSDILLIDFVDL